MPDLKGMREYLVRGSLIQPIRGFRRRVRCIPIWNKPYSSGLEIWRRRGTSDMGLRGLNRQRSVEVKGC